MRQSRLGVMLWGTATGLFLVFLLAPLLILIAVSVNPTTIVFPPQGFTLKWYGVIFEKPEFLQAAWASTLLGILTAAFSTSLGVLAAIGLKRHDGAMKAPISFALMSPLFIPAVILALALFQLLFMMGIANSLWVLVAAHVVVTLPYPVRNVMAQLERFDYRLEEAALTVGATPGQALTRVTLPLLRASIVPSLIITFVLSWNNYTVSIFLSGKDWITLPLQLRAYLQYEYEPFVAAMSTLLIIVSAILLVVVERSFGLAGVRKPSGISP